MISKHMGLTALSYFHDVWNTNNNIPNYRKKKTRLKILMQNRHIYEPRHDKTNVICKASKGVQARNAASEDELVVIR
jgi:hypothetical protein